MQFTRAVQPAGYVKWAAAVLDITIAGRHISSASATCIIFNIPMQFPK